MKKYLIPILVFLGLFYYTYASSWDARRAMRPKFSIPQETSTRPVIDWHGELGEGTFTRNSPVNYWGTDGVMHSGVTDEEVYQCVGMSGTTPAYNCANCELAGLREPASTNSILGARDCDNAAIWTLTASATQDQTGIFGDANSGVSCTDDDGAAVEYIVQDIVIPDDSNTYTFSVYIKKDSNEARFPMANIRVVGGSAIKHKVMLNTKTGNWNEIDDEGSDNVGVINCGDWWRFWAGVTNNGSGNTKFQVFLYPAGGTAWGIQDVAATGTIIVDGIQVELNTKAPSSFIDTQGAPVTRATTSGYPRYTLPTNTFAESLGAELVLNPGLETGGTGGNFNGGAEIDDNTQDGFTSWTVSADDGNRRVEATATKHGGNYAAKLYRITDSPVINQAFSVTSNALYKCSVWTQGDGTNSIRFKVADNTNAVTLYDEFTGLTAAAYNQFTIYIAAPPTCTEFKVYARNIISGTTLYVDDFSCKQVTKARNDQPCPGTAVIWWRPGFNIPAGGDKAILSLKNSDFSLLRHNNVGFYSYDGSVEVGKNIAFTSGSWYKLVIQWGYLVSNAAKYRVGYDNGSGITWGTAGNYDGAFDTTGNLLKITHNMEGPMHTKRLAIFDRILSDAEINAMGSPIN